MKKNKEKIVTFGEIMLRLTPPEYTTIVLSNSFVATYGGGEANVAVSLSYLGHKTEFVTKLPPNQLGDGAIRYLHEHNVGTDYIARGSSTIGMYFLETGFGGRPSKVVYNRKHSAVTHIGVNDIDYDAIFKDATWFHVSGISLALGAKTRKVVFACLEACKKYGVTVSFDFNYRKKLWTIEEARPFYKEIMPYVDVLFSSYFDAATILEYPERDDISDPQEKRVEIFQRVLNDYDIKYVFGTDRTIYSSTENALSAFCISKTQSFKEDKIKFNIYDRIGGGDAYASGVIHGLLQDYENPQYALKFGLATSVLKHTLYGDACTLAVDDIENFLKNGASGVQR